MEVTRQHSLNTKLLKKQKVISYLYTVYADFEKYHHIMSMFTYFSGCPATEYALIYFVHAKHMFGLEKQARSKQSMKQVTNLPM